MAEYRANCRLWRIATIFWGIFLCAAGSFAQPFARVEVSHGRVPLAKGPWVLVFHDEFNSATLDTLKWITYFPYGPAGSDSCAYCRTHGREGQVYLDRNVLLGDGLARLAIRREPVHWMGESRSFSSGMLHTRPPWKFRYGRFEMRCRLPRGMGFWPAFWLYGWGGNEIDVFELGMQFPDLQFTNIHKEISGRHFDAGQRHYGPDYARDFHLFTLEWDPWSIRWLVDGEEKRRLNRLAELRGKTPIDPGAILGAGLYLENQLMPDWPLDLIINVAVGVDGVTPFTGSPDAQTQLPGFMEIDYVRVYQRQGDFPDLCSGRRLIIPDRLTGPTLVRFDGPYARLDWAVSQGLKILDRFPDAVVIAPSGGSGSQVQWIEVGADQDGQGPCPALQLREYFRFW